MGAAEALRRERIEKVRRTFQPATRAGRMMYLCETCRKWTYSLQVHRCGRSWSGGGD